jgi:hypothetical protein
MKTVRWCALGAVVSTLSPATAFSAPPRGTEAVTISPATVDGIDYITVTGVVGRCWPLPG